MLPNIGKMQFHPWRRTLAIGLVIAVSSQLYLNLFINNFRISISVVLLPILLMTLGLQLHTMPICASTALIVFLFRLCILLLRGDIPEDSALQVIPGALFYIFYGILFKLQIRNKHIATLRSVTMAVFFCDFCSNVLEFLLRCRLLGLPLPTSDELGTLLLIAVIRTGLAGGFLVLDREYRELQVRHEQERRYQKLFVMITGLKGELYLMRKNSEEIERIMGNAYRLHESVQRENLPPEVQQMSLDIARDVHEIKKDYFRIMQGIEETIGDDYEEETMRLSELLEILEGTAHQVLLEKKLDISLIFDCDTDFETDAHYSLMTILKNLVSNAIEAISDDRKKGTIFVIERMEEEEICFRIVDNGPGIPEKNLQKIFRMGYSTKFDGKTGNIYRGVGLVGVKNVLEEQFGGTIRVESDPGVRTVFEVRIPKKNLIRQKGRPESQKTDGSKTDSSKAESSEADGGKEAQAAGGGLGS